MTSAFSMELKEIVREQFEYRTLLYQMTKRDLMLRYKQTIMGFGWAVFMPLVNTAVFSVIFMRVAPIETQVPYPLFAFCGLWVWNFFASSLKFSVGSLTSNANLVTKIYFPREVFPISAVIVSLVDFAVAGSVLVCLMVYYRVPVGLSLLFLPLVVLIHVMLTTAVAFMLARWNLFYRDVKYVFEIAIVIWMFATSVVYPIELVGGRLGVIMRLNPVTPIIEAYRAVLLYGTAPSLGSLAGSAAVALLLLVWSWIAFHRSEFQFAENV